MIPFSPPRVDEVTIAAVTEALRSGWITTGPRTKRLENELALYLGVGRVACFGSWTGAAELVLRWFGIGPGDEVIVPAYTYAASANIIAHTGATIVFADSLAGSFNVDPEDIARKITSRTKAVIPVDLGGFPADYERIMQVLATAPFSPSNPIQEELGRPLLFADAAHSFGSRVDGKHSCHSADISGYSFHAVKNLTTAEGGALAFNLPTKFNLDEVYNWFMRMSLHGQSKDALAKTAGGSWKYDILDHGFKCNMTDLQAAIGLVELGRYENDMLVKRDHLCKLYDRMLGAYDWAILPTRRDERRSSSNHLYMVRIDRITEEHRDSIIAQMLKMEVHVNVHFMPLPTLTAFSRLGFSPLQVPNAMAAYTNEISLPLYYDLSDQQVEEVVQKLAISVKAVVS